MNDNCVFFWGGPFSNFYPAKIVVDGITYFCTEQYFMSKKALHFGDEETNTLIMQSTDPKTAKKLGRQVKGFIAKEWDNVSRTYMFEANYAKFTQHKRLKDELLATGNKKLAEASPFDNLWGLGLDAFHAARIDESEWPGKNWLGEVLMLVREKIREEIGDDKN